MCINFIIAGGIPTQDRMIRTNDKISYCSSTILSYQRGWSSVTHMTVSGYSTRQSQAISYATLQAIPHATPQDIPHASPQAIPHATLQAIPYATPTALHRLQYVKSRSLIPTFQAMKSWVQWGPRNEARPYALSMRLYRKRERGTKSSRGKVLEDA